jgi:hypothetical protein
MVFFFLGVFSTLGVIGIWLAIKRLNAGGPMIALLSTGLFLILFSFAWSASSILEHEHQAANMGILFFGLPGILCLGLAWKKLSRKNQIKPETE